MASLSNINGLFDVHSTGAILFSTSHGTSGQILRSNGNAAPTWVAASTVIGGPYLPLTGGTLSGPLSGTSATFSGTLTVGGNNVVGFSGSWNGVDMPGSRWNGYTVNGGEIVFQRDNPISGQMSILVDGGYYAGENNGFYSLYSSSSYNSKAGFYADTSGVLQFNAPATFTGLVSGITPTAAANFATKAYVDAQPQGDLTSITLGNGLTGSSLSGPIPNVLMSGSYTGTFTATSLASDSFLNNAGNLLFSAGNTTTGASRSLNLRTSNPTSDPSSSDDSNSTGITWGQRTDSNPYYIIYPNLENYNSSGNYSKLTLAWHTGIKIGAASVYGGTRFYNNSPDIAGAAVIMNVGVGNDNIGVINALTVGTTISAGNATFAGTLAAGATTLTSTNPSILVLNPTASNYGGITFKYGGVTKGTSIYNSGSMVYGGEVGTFTRLQSGGQYCFHADATNQNVHIGGTTDTTYKLQVTGTTYTSGNATFAGNITLTPGNSNKIILTPDLTSHYITANSYWIDVVGNQHEVFRVFGGVGGTSEYFRVAGDGNVGIGNTNPSAKLSVNSDALGSAVGSQTRQALFSASDGNTSHLEIKDIRSSTVQNWTGAGKRIQCRVDSTYMAYMQFNGTGNNYGISFGTGATTTAPGNVAEKMRIESGGDVGIGTSSPTSKLHVFGGSANTELKVTTNDNYIARIGMYEEEAGASHGGFIQYRGELSDRLEFGSKNSGTDTVHMSISDLYGNVGIGTAPNAGVAGDRLKIQGGNNGLGCIKAISGQYSYGVRIEGSNISTQLACYSSSTAQTTQINFENPGNSSAGKISTTGNSTAYTTSSDYRLKENVIPISDSIYRLNQLKPSRFNFIGESNKTVDGFIAHEVQDIVPEAIVGEKDEIDKDGNPVHQGIDQAKLVPLLVAAIQELEARVKELENK